MGTHEFFNFNPMKRHSITSCAVLSMICIGLFDQKILGGMVQLVAFLGFLYFIYLNYGDMVSTEVIGGEHGSDTEERVISTDDSSSSTSEDTSDS